MIFQCAQIVNFIALYFYCMSTIVSFVSNFDFSEETSEIVETSMAGLLGTTLYHLSYTKEQLLSNNVSSGLTHNEIWQDDINLLA